MLVLLLVKGVGVNILEGVMISFVWTIHPFKNTSKYINKKLKITFFFIFSSNSYRSTMLGL